MLSNAAFRDLYLNAPASLTTYSGSRVTVGASADVKGITTVNTLGSEGAPADLNAGVNSASATLQMSIGGIPSAERMSSVGFGAVDHASTKAEDTFNINTNFKINNLAFPNSTGTVSTYDMQWVGVVGMDPDDGNIQKGFVVLAGTQGTGTPGAQSVVCADREEGSLTRKECKVTWVL
jgi:hypothetical protein